MFNNAIAKPFQTRVKGFFFLSYSREVIIINKSDLFPNLEEITFCGKDVDTITQEVISRYESITGRSLARADPVRLFLNTVIYELVLQRNSIDLAAKMNLLAYAYGEYLDHLGALLGVSRLDAVSAVCSVQFTLSAALAYDVTIPEGTRITPDGKIYFATTSDIVITAGNTQGIITAKCQTAGSSGNDYVAGQINQIVDPFPYGLTGENITVSSGGEDAETDEAFRARIQIAPEHYTNAGSIEGYRYYALSADPDILDVSILTPPDVAPGNVYIYVLMNGGALPDSDTLDKVLAVCSGETVRPDTDYVHTLPPEQVSYSVDVNYWVDVQDSVILETIQANVQSAVLNWIEWQGSKIGRDINPSQLHHDIISAGAKRCEIISPAFTILSSYQTAFTSSPLSINFQGLEN